MSVDDDALGTCLKPVAVPGCNVFDCSDDDRNLSALRPTAQLFQEFEAVHARHHEVKNDHRRSSYLQYLKNVSR